MDFDNEAWMRTALDLAQAALREGEVPVGCIFIHNNQIIAEGKNSVNKTKNATRHAEFNCIDIVLDKMKNDPSLGLSFNDVSVVVTVEPCIMCADALHSLGVARIVFGCPNDRFGGCGSIFDVESVHSKPVPVIPHILSDEAMNLLKTFYKGTNPNAPPDKVKVKK